MPKAGTHLLMKAMGMFPGIRRTRGQINNQISERYPPPRADQATTEIGVDWPRPVSLTALRDALHHIRPGRFALAHTRFSDELAHLLNDLDMRTLLILRDPRDVVVSHAHYVANKPSHFLYSIYQPLSEPQRIMASIKGIPPSAPEAPALLSIGERYRSLLPWLSHPLNATTRFEKLVGPQGGGSRENQVQEIRNCARHLNIRYSPDRLEYIATRLFGKTDTFRRGVIGGWKRHLSYEHKQALKEVAGPVLIELGYERHNDW
jgi:hypothetical protein